MHVDEVRRILIIGGGTMGQQSAAMRDPRLPVVLYDIEPAALRRRRTASAPTPTIFGRRASLTRSGTSAHNGDHNECRSGNRGCRVDLVSESVPEDPALKGRVWDSSTSCARRGKSSRRTRRRCSPRCLPSRPGGPTGSRPSISTRPCGRRTWPTSCPPGHVGPDDRPSASPSPGASGRSPSICATRATATSSTRCTPRSTRRRSRSQRTGSRPSRTSTAPGWAS